MGEAVEGEVEAGQVGAGGGEGWGDGGDAVVIEVEGEEGWAEPWDWGDFGDPVLAKIDVADGGGSLDLLERFNLFMNQHQSVLIRYYNY